MNGFQGKTTSVLGCKQTKLKVKKNNTYFVVSWHSSVNTLVSILMSRYKWYVVVSFY